jgi:hypothetical protein
MQTKTRIPALPNKSYFAMNRWFYKMHQSGLLYHPDEQAENIVNIQTGEPSFTPQECEVLNTLMNQMFETHGDKVYEVCLNHVHKSMGIQPE